MKSIRKLTAILLAAATCAAWPSLAQDSTPPATNTAPATPRARRPNNRYTGIISSIDAPNMVLTLKGRNKETKVKITSATRIRKDREPATFTDAVEGLRVMGSGKLGEDGVWTATTLNILTKAPVRRAPPATTNSAASQ